MAAVLLVAPALFGLSRSAAQTRVRKAASLGRQVQRGVQQIGPRRAAVVGGVVAAGMVARWATKKGKRRLERNHQTMRLPARRPAGLSVASSNMMFGRKLNGMLGHYKGLQENFGVDLLLLQETNAKRTETVRAALGEHYKTTTHTGLGLVYDPARVDVLDTSEIELPMKSKLNRIEKTYIRDGSPEQRYAQVIRLRDRSSSGVLHVVNTHLDAGMSNAIRTEQVLKVVEHLRTTMRPDDKLVFAGDTNAFAFRKQLLQLRRVLEPLAELGVAATNTHTTKLFSRAVEPQRAKQLLAFIAARVGDFPATLDVVATSKNLKASESYIYSTGNDSDHDIVFRFVQP